MTGEDSKLRVLQPKPHAVVGSKRVAEEGDGLGEIAHIDESYFRAAPQPPHNLSLFSSSKEGASREGPAAIRAVADDEADAEEEEGPAPSPPLVQPCGGAKDGGGVAPFSEEGPPKASPPTWADRPRDAGESVEPEVSPGPEEVLGGEGLRYRWPGGAFLCGIATIIVYVAQASSNRHSGARRWAQ